MGELELRDYQKECIETVFNRINGEEKHISVVMPVGYGRTIVSLLIAKKLIEENVHKIALIFRTKAEAHQAKVRAEEIGIYEGLSFYTVLSLPSDLSAFQYVFIYGASVFDRKQVMEVIKNSNVRTLSFSSLGQEISSGNLSNQGNRRLEYTELIPSVIGVYSTKDVLDIRDAKYAGKDELIYAQNANSEDLRLIQVEKKETLKLYYSMSTQKDHLMAYVKALKRFEEKRHKESLLELEELRAKVQVDEQNKKIEELTKKIAYYEKQVEEQTSRIAQQDSLIAFQQEVLSGFGINAEVLQESFDQINKLKESLKSNLESDDETVKEIATKQVQDKAAEVVGDLMQSVLSVKDQEYFKEYLSGILTANVWNRLDDKSKTFLITARSNYEGMIKMNGRETLDYSGVCLLVTKALEVEVTKRFLLLYVDYLTQKYDTVAKWPYALRKRREGQITEEVIDEDEFTLGSVVPLLGLKRTYAENQLHGFEMNKKTAWNEFLNYAGNILFDSTNRQRIEVEIEKDYRFIEKVRMDYRNPAAHKDQLSMTSAKECMEYVIDVQKMLKEMLIYMKV